MTTMAARLEAGWLERKFRFTEHGTTLVRDTSRAPRRSW